METALLTIQRPTEITANQIAGLLCTALEGCVTPCHLTQKTVWGDWRASCLYTPSGKYRNHPQFCITAPNYKLEFVDGDGKKSTLTLPKLKRGVKVMARDYGKHFEDFLNGNEDAITGDVFVQCSLFGKVIYG